jgi:hypothetical protein
MGQGKTWRSSFHRTDDDMKISINGNRYNLPNFLIVGAARSATTTLFYHLEQHRDIVMSSIKEPHFFSFYSTRPNCMQISRNKVEPFLYDKYSYSLPHYSALYMPMYDYQILGEASTSYLYFHDQVISNIDALYGSLSKQVKIIILLRNPVDRAWSHYMFHTRNGREYLGLLEAVNPQCIMSRIDHGISYNWDYLGFGYYYEQVKAYMDAFDDVVVILTEDFTRDPIGILTTIMHSIEVSPNMPQCLSGVYNVSGKPKNKLSAFISQIIYQPNSLGKFIKKSLPISLIQRLKYMRYKASDFLIEQEAMSANERLYLMEFYRPDISKLSRLLNRNLDHWLN